MDSMPSVNDLMFSSSSPMTSLSVSADGSEVGVRLSTLLITATVPHDWLLTWLQKNPGKLAS